MEGMKRMGKLTIGFAGLNFSNFAAEEYGVFPKAKSVLGQLARNWDFNLVSADTTIQTSDETEALCRQFEDAKVDFVLVQSSSFSMGDVFLPLGRMQKPLGLWALREPSFEGQNPLNSFTGFHMLTSIAREYITERVLPIKWFFGDPESSLFQRRLKLSIQSLSALKKLRGTRVALVGDIAPTFYQLTYDTKHIEKRLGVIVEQIPITKVFAKTGGYSQTLLSDLTIEMKKRAARIDVSDEWMNQTSRVVLALRDVALMGEYDALALRCFPEFQNEMDGLGPCAAVGWLNETGLPVACEGDVMSALSMLVLNLLSNQPTTVFDMAAIDIENGLAQLWHCGASPPSLADEQGQSLIYHPTLDRASPQGAKPHGTSSDLLVAPGPVTVFRFTPKADKAFIMLADSVKGPTRGYNGSRAWLSNFRIKGERMGILDLIETITFNGLPQHYPMVHGDWNDVLHELIAWSGIEALEKVEYRDYLVS